MCCNQSAINLHTGLRLTGLVALEHLDYSDTFGEKQFNKEISLDLRKRIVDAHHEGKGYTASSKHFTVTKTAVWCIIAKHQGRKSVANKPGCGQKLKILKTLERKIIRDVNKDPQVSAKVMVAGLFWSRCVKGDSCTSSRSPFKKSSIAETTAHQCLTEVKHSGWGCWFHSSDSIPTHRLECVFCSSHHRLSN